MGVKHTVLQDGQPQLQHSLCLHRYVAQRLMKWRSVPPYSPKMAREGTFALFDFLKEKASQLIRYPSSEPPIHSHHRVTFPIEDL